MFIFMFPIQKFEVYINLIKFITIVGEDNKIETQFTHCIITSGKGRVVVGCGDRGVTL